MRFLRPGWLLPSESGLWIVDEFQPVAALLSGPSGAGVSEVVSWPELPPASRTFDWPGPTVIGDGASLWTQQHRTGPVLRIAADGGRSAAWTDGLQLAACGPGEAWCFPSAPRQELLQGADAQPMTLSNSGLSALLRIGQDGRQERIWVDRPIRAIHAVADALIVAVDDDPWTLRHLGIDTYEVVRTLRYLPIPWGCELPARLSVDEGGWSVERPPGIRSTPSPSAMTWYDQTADPRAVLHAAGLRWRLGRTHSGAQTNRPWFPVRATAHNDAGTIVADFDLGAGSITAVSSYDADTAVAVALRRPGPTHPVEVLCLRPDGDIAETLIAADGLDISDRCWPLVQRPVETDSYAQQILAANDSLESYWIGADGVKPLADGISDVTTRLDRPWPDTHLVWTFRWTMRPGLTLRRRVPLYDELGRPVKPEFADIHLKEQLDTGAIPAALAAVNGVLEI